MARHDLRKAQMFTSAAITAKTGPTFIRTPGALLEQKVADQSLEALCLAARVVVKAFSKLACGQAIHTK